MRSPAEGAEFHRWRTEFECYGLTVALRFDLRGLLMPRISLREPFAWPPEVREEVADPRNHMDRLVEAEVVLATKGVRHHIEKLSGDKQWTEALPQLLDDFTSLLRDALDLMVRRELGQTEEGSDLSYLHQLSISEHAQNHGYPDWITLIELVRDAWLQTRVRSPEDARIAAEAWWRVPYPVFRRLAFFAATHDEIIPRSQAVDWLLADGCWWLWASETHSEAMRLLGILGPRMVGEELARVEKALLAGPPLGLRPSDLAPKQWARIQDQDTWFGLAKLAEGGASLSATGIARMEEISARDPTWRLGEDEREEVSAWTGAWSERRGLVATPRNPLELFEYLKTHGEGKPWHGDDWSTRCRDDLDGACGTLSELAKQDSWPKRAWLEAMRVWTDESLIAKAWPLIAPVLARSPNGALYALGDGVSRWVLAFAKTFKGRDATLLTLCDRLLGLGYNEERDVGDPVGRAINHPVGHAVDALLQWWDRAPLTDAQGLDDHLKRRFSRICDVRAGAMRHGRVLLAAHIIALFRVDRDWATQCLLPLFSWKRSMREAKGAWTGFLWTPRLYAPLMEVLKPEFLDTAHYYEELGRYGSQYSSLLTLAGLDPQSVFTRSELRKATMALPQEGLDTAAATLVQALEGAAAQRNEYWKNRVLPYVKEIWPKTQESASASIAENFALLCVASGQEFRVALEELEPWLQEVEYPDRIVQRLHEAVLHEQFPEEALGLLDAIVGEEPEWLPKDEMEGCLRAIRTRRPELKADYRYRRLVELVKRRAS